ncbi:MAG: hypothetical protein NVS3B20_17050 [Polyangiales bacterium]
MQTLSFLSLLACGSIACSSSSSPPANSSGDGAINEPKVPDESCVRPGDKGNDKGIGTYCTPLGKECNAFDGAPVCLADVGQKQWMCTRIGCTGDQDCGKDTKCYFDPKGSACVPNRCSTKSGDAGTDASDLKVPDQSCVRPGEKGNEKGVGTFCTPLGKECDSFGPPLFCLADVGQTQWMCSRMCKADPDCGTDATCFMDPKGNACLPNRCVPKKADAGADG